MLQTIDQALSETNALLEHHVKQWTNELDTIDKLTLTQQKENSINEQLKQANSIEALNLLIDQLDEIIDLKMGIIRVTKENALAHISSDKKSPLVIRDARFQNSLKQDQYQKPEDVPQSFQALITAQMRGILWAIDQDTHTLGDPESKTKAKNEVLTIFKDTFALYSYSPTTNLEKQKHLKKFNHSIATILKKHDLTINGQGFAKLSDKKISSAMAAMRDYTNFSKPSPTICTISPNISANDAQSLYYVTSSIPLNPVKAGSDRYKDLDQQEWFKEMTPIEQALATKYQFEVKNGQHIIPTQLRNLAGIKNGYLQQTSVIKAEGSTLDATIMLRSGTLAHNLGNGTESEPLTKENIEHLKTITTAAKKELHLAVLNPDLGAIISQISPGAKLERKINNMMMRFKDSTSISNNTFINPLTKNQNLQNISSNYDQYNAPNSTHIMHVSCKSGKDRTGFAAFMCGLLYTSSKQIDGYKIKPRTELELVLAQTFHEEELASRNTIGVKALRSGNAMKYIKMLTAKTKTLLGRNKLSHAPSTPLSERLPAHKTPSTLEAASKEKRGYQTF
jgi:hypothetical protein